MAVTLAQAAEHYNSPVRRGAVQIAVDNSTVLDRLAFEDIEGNAYAYNADAVLPGTAFRTVNEAYIESTGVVNSRVEVLTILGGDCDVDRFIERTSGRDVPVLLAEQIEMKVKSAQATYSNAVFNGDDEVDSKSFNGLRKRLIGKQVLDAEHALDSELFLDDLDLLMGAVAGADVLYAPAAVLTRLKALGRKVGGAEYINSEITGKREFTWNGTPIVDPGLTWDGRPILSVDSTNGADIYALKLAQSDSEVGVMGITNGGLDAYEIGELPGRPAYRGRVEFYSGLVVQGGRAAARLRGIKLK